jgi:hypothetical protein
LIPALVDSISPAKAAREASKSWPMRASWRGVAGTVRELIACSRWAARIIRW